MLSGGVAVTRIHKVVTTLGAAGAAGLGLGFPVLFIVFDLFLLISVAALALGQTSQVARNVTTNELANWHRYRYLSAPNGEYHNPFDKGWRRNCREVCNPDANPTAPYVLPTDPLFQKGGV